MNITLKKGQKILVLMSYCDNCKDELPCQECLEKNNVAEVLIDTPIDVFDGIGYRREMQK